MLIFKSASQPQSLHPGWTTRRQDRAQQRPRCGLSRTNSITKIQWARTVHQALRAQSLIGWTGATPLHSGNYYHVHVGETEGLAKATQQVRGRARNLARPWHVISVTLPFCLFQIIMIRYLKINSSSKKKLLHLHLAPKQAEWLESSFALAAAGPRPLQHSTKLTALLPNHLYYVHTVVKV